MKKVVRTVWISLLSGLAFLVACTTPKGLSRAEKKQLKAERAHLVALLEENAGIDCDDPKSCIALRQEEYGIREQISAIDYQLHNDEGGAENLSRMAELSKEIDSINQVIADMENEIPPCVYGPPADDPIYLNEKEQHRQELSERLEALRVTIRRREGACVYGSPEVIQKYGEETRRLKTEAKALEKELEELDNE